MRSSTKPSSPRLWKLVLLMVILVALFALIDPVQAKGPESLTISGPGFDQPVNFMDDNNYETRADLLEQTGLWYGTGKLLSTEEIKGELGPRYTFTWVNAGPPSLSIEERTIIQYIYLKAAGGPIIHTPPQDSLKEWGSGTIGWFAAPDGLGDTLAKLGVPGFGSQTVLDAHIFKASADTVLAEPTPIGSPWFLTVVGVAILGMFGLIAISLVKGKILTS
jgi:hypothetical protein